EFSMANPYVQKMLGRSNTEIIGTPLFEVVFQDDILAAEEQCREARNSSDLHSFELRLKHKNGRIIDTRWTVFWSDIQKALFCVVHDITEQKNIDRLKQDFVDMVSHDLRSPLMSMGGTMELIAAGATGELTPAVQKEVLTAQRNIDRLTDFVNDL